MGTCKDCIYWGAYYPLACDRTDNIQTSEGNKRFTISARADDDQGLEAYLITGPDFGCIHFKYDEGYTA